jgi:hypothetical protein
MHKIIYNSNGQAAVKTTVFILSLAASRFDDTYRFVEHHPSIAQEAHTENEALEFGFREAENLWPAAQGWEHDVKVASVDWEFEISNIQMPEKS